METPLLPARGRPRSTDADRAITVATLGLLEDHGYGGLTMGAVAERAGVSSATLYRRCSSKEELVVGALACLVPDRPAADTGSLDGDLRQMLRRIGENMSGEKGRLLLGLAGEIIRHPALAEAVRARLSMPMQLNLGALLDRATKRGDIPPIADLQVVIALLVGPLHFWLLSGETISPGLIETLVPMLLRALGAASVE
jgi:AcrR family transcriptional regulator